jgi:hypothetical protein
VGNGLDGIDCVAVKLGSFAVSKSDDSETFRINL